MSAPKNGGLVYRLTFPNGKVYIGVTTQTLSKRLKAHRASAKAKSPKSAVHRAWKLHGEPIAEVLSEHSTAADLLLAETLAIFTNNSYGDGGYNMTWGGEMSPAKDPAVLAKIRERAKDPLRVARCVAAHLGSKRSEETRANISAALKGKRKGIKFSDEHKARIAASSKGHKRNLGRKNSPETLARMSESAYKRWADGCPESTRKKMSESAKKRWASK